MKTLLILTVALVLGASCAGHPGSQTSNGAASQSTVISASPEPAGTEARYGKESEKKKDVPQKFSKVDFKNFSYPISFNLNVKRYFRSQSFRLRDGSYEYPARKGGGGATYDLRDVDFVDLTGDGEKKAVVRVSQVLCGGSCDGGSDFFYFYSIAKGQVRLLSHLETGSAGYDCGLKTFILKKQVLNLETFRVCRFNGVEVYPVNDDPNQTGGKFLTNRFTRFVLRFNGNRFVLSQRKVFPCPEEDRRSYKPKIEISND